jgi:hypothetical protein
LLLWPESFKKLIPQSLTSSTAVLGMIGNGQ